MTHATTWMKLEDIMVTEIKPVTKRKILDDSIYMRHLESSDSEAENRMVVTRGWRE